MRVEVDYDRCEGHEICVKLAPNVFEISDDDEQVRVVNPTPGESEKANIILASQRCPRVAIMVTQ